MAILDILEFFDESGEIMINRMPSEGSGEFRLGTQLIVQESQSAVFFRGGKALDAFGAGRHTLAAQNLPLLQRIIGLPFGGKSPFRAYVYFVALKTFSNLGWGTPTPVTFRDADFRMVTLRAHGIYSMRIRDARVFLNTLVGTKGIETTFGLEDFFRSMIVSRLNTTISETMKSILDLPAQYANIALKVKQSVKDDFEQYGIELIDLIVEAITVPREVQEMINRATGIAAQDVEKYKDIAIADAMRDAAQNPGGTGQGVGMGVGLGVGFGMAKQFSDQLSGGPKPPAETDKTPKESAEGDQPAGDAPADESTPPPTPAQPAEPPSANDVKSRLRHLKEMHDEGLITDEDFAEHKKRLLEGL